MKEELQKIRSELDKLYDVVWGEDITSPTIPEYQEHHESIQRILKSVHQLMEKVDRMMKSDGK